MDLFTKNAYMIGLIESGIVCLVSMFFIWNRLDSLEKPDVLETTYSNQLV